MNYFINIFFIFSLAFITSCGSFSERKSIYTYRSLAQINELNTEQTRKIYETTVFRELLKDVLFELDHFDGIDPWSEEVIRVKESLKNFIENGDFYTFQESLDSKWKAFFTLSIVEQNPSSSEIRTIHSSILEYERHTLNNVDEYVENRIGPSISQNTKAGNVGVSVHAGGATHIASSFSRDGAELVRIPSLYEKWGISKFIDTKTLRETIPQIYFNVPPINEYAEHYAKMLGLLTESSNVRVNLDDRVKLQEQFDKEVSELFERGKIKEQAHITLGYSGRFEELVKADLKEWDIISTDEIESTGELGISAKKYKLTNKRNPEIKIDLVSMSASTTLWGEGSAFLSNAVVKHNPKSFVFMGSAGLIQGQRGAYYDASVPSDFMKSSGEVNIDNMIFSHYEHGKDYRVSKDSIIWGTRHAHSSSPAEQTQRWLKDKKRKTVSTVDVEVSLIADSVRIHNQDNFANVDFGVINLVTDKPSLSAEDEVDLNNVSASEKRRGQLSIVDTYFDSLSSYENYIADFDKNIRENILRHLPGLEEGDIKIYNGMGKIDASDKHKLSYYVYNANPNSPTSETVLIPMATSRFDRYNYHTDQWWSKYGEAYQRGETVPMEDPSDIAKYLRENGLSTNPDVITFDNIRGPPQKTKLKDFLLQEYIKNYSKDGYVYLYRGVAKSTEVADWKSGKVPRGVRYWTPDINYAWRYGRKRDDLVSGLIKGESPMVQFKIPESEFVNMVRNNEIVLGAELPKSAHKAFASDRVFKDNLMGMPYLGSETFGVELEVRARRKARKKMIRYFDGTISIEDLVKDRINKLEATYRRLIVNDPHRRSDLLAQMKQRIETTKIEAQILIASQDGKAPEEISELSRKISGRKREITNTSREGLESAAKSLSGKFNISRSRICSDFLMELMK